MSLLLSRHYVTPAHQMRSYGLRLAFEASLIALIDDVDIGELAEQACELWALSAQMVEVWS